MKDTLQLISQGLTFFLVWIAIPSIMLGISLLARSIMSRIPEGENKVSARAGWWAGLVLFAIYFFYEMPSFHVLEISVQASLRLDILGVLLGSIGGFFLLWVLKCVVSTRVVGFVILFLCFSGFAALYTYFFLSIFNNVLASSVLGIAFGSLIHVVAMPDSVKTILPIKKERKE